MTWLRAGFSLILLLLSYITQPCLSKPSPSQDDNGETVLKCLLRRFPRQPCGKNTGYMLPSRFRELYHNMTDETKESFRMHKLEILAPEKFAQIPIHLFLLIPSHHLRHVPGSSLAALLRSNPQDVSVAIKIMRILNTARLEDFFSKLEEVELSTRTQDKIAETLVTLLPDVNSSWTFTRFRMIEKIGDPLVAHLPPKFLSGLSNSEAIRFLYHFRNWLWSNLPENIWENKSEASKRAWTDLMLRSSYPVNLTKWTGNEGRRFRYFLEGATPDELGLLTAEQLHDSRLFKARLKTLQVRALFNTLYSNKELTSANLTDAQLLPAALKLSPTNLQRFNISTDFRELFSLKSELPSFLTSLQILESLIAQSVSSRRLKSVNPETWGDGIEHLGKFVYALPVSALKSYRHSPPSLITQSSVDSYQLSSRQARLLTGGIVLDFDKPDVALGRRGLLRALPSHKITDVYTVPQTVLSHLLSSLPPQLPMQAEALIRKVGKLSGKTWALKNILSNRNPNQFFELLNPRKLATIEMDLRSMKGFDNAIRSLPENTLSVLLSSQRKRLTSENVLWTSESLLSGEMSRMLLGLSCNDIYAMETADFIVIMGQYNKERTYIGKPFPKDLQYCTQMALMNYLEMKASLQDDKDLDQFLDYLELADIEAVGGYILSNIPSENIMNCTRKKQILEAIGELPLPELLVATKEVNPWQYAELLLQQYFSPNETEIQVKSEQLFGLGNLFHFLTPEHIAKIDSVSFKLFLESIGDHKSKTVCANQATRTAWYQLLVQMFGEPFKWTAGILGTLGDMLLVLPSKALSSIPEESWSDAADTLVQQTSYNLKIEWPGKVDHIAFYQACAERLERSESSRYISAVCQLARWYLAAVQTQLDSVVNASRLLVAAHKAKVKAKSERRLIHDLPSRVILPIEASGIKQGDKLERTKKNMDSTTVNYFGSGDEVTTEDAFDYEELFATTTTTEVPSSTITSPRTVLSITSQTDEVQSTTVVSSTELISNLKPQVFNPMEESGEVLRGILKEQHLVKETKPESVTTHNPHKADMSTVKPRRKQTRPWIKVSCNAIKAAGKPAELVIDETDIELMGPLELDDCVETLGSLELDRSVQSKIWNSIDKEKFLENLSDLGNLVKAVDVDEVSRINLNLDSTYTLDNLATLSRKVTDPHVLHELGSHFLKSNPGLKMLSIEVVVALGRILCDVMEVSSQKVHEMLGQTVFLKSSPVLGQMKECPTRCLHKLVHLATKSTEYGSLDTWTAEDVATLGIIPAGLKAEQWKQLTSTGYGNNPLVGLTPSAVKHIPSQIFKELDEDQLKSLRALSSAVVSEEQKSHLSESQQLALLRIQRDVPVLKHSSENDIVEDYQSESSVAVKAAIMDVILLSVCVVAVIIR